MKYEGLYLIVVSCDGSFFSYISGSDELEKNVLKEYFGEGPSYGNQEEIDSILSHMRDEDQWSESGQRLRMSEEQGYLDVIKITHTDTIAFW